MMIGGTSNVRTRPFAYTVIGAAGWVNPVRGAISATATIARTTKPTLRFIRIPSFPRQVVPRGLCASAYVTADVECVQLRTLDGFVRKRAWGPALTGRPHTRLVTRARST